MNYSTRMVYLCFVLVCLKTIACVAADEAMAESTVPTQTQVLQGTQQQAAQELGIEQLNLPDDTSARFTVREVRS